MNSVRRAPQSLKDVLSAAQPLKYVCRNCRSAALHPRVLTAQQVRHASDNIPFTEKVRRKLWGTDNPPGLKDPYGGPSFLERRQMRKKLEQEGREAQIAYEEPERGQVYSGSTEVPFSAEVDGMREDVPLEEYKPAETWEGLMHMGHKAHWKDLPPQAQDEFVPWISSSPKSASNRFELLSCLHQAIIECLTCERLDLDPATALQLDPEFYDPEGMAQIKVTASNGPVSGVEYPSEDTKNFLEEMLRNVAAESIESRDTELDEAAEGRMEAKHSEENAAMDFVSSGEITRNEFPMFTHVSYYAPQDESFLSLRFDFSRPTTFTILKRFTQLSGHRISDPILNSLISPRNPRTLSYLVERLADAVKPKPKNLAEKLMQKQDLLGQGNIMILPRRETPVDKEKEIGRWKVIERELKSRGLPVLGRAS